jgi:hypothetical protein
MSKGFSKHYINPFYFVFTILCSHIYSSLAFPRLQATRAYFANIRKKKMDQIEAGLRRKEAQVVESEKREAKALERFMAKKNTKFSILLQTYVRSSRKSTKVESHCTLLLCKWKFSSRNYNTDVTIY